MTQRTIDLTKKRDLDITFVTLRTTTANDTLDAAGRCLPEEGKSMDGNVFALMMRHQTVVQAIVDYTDKNGVIKKTPGGCLEFMEWNSRTREYCGEIYDYMNGVASDEREDFRKELAGIAPVKTSPAT